MRRSGWTQRVVLLPTRALLLVALACGPALPESRVVQTIDGREFLLLSIQEVPLHDGARLLRMDFEAHAYADRDASRREAHGLLGPLAAQLAGRKQVMVVANGPRTDPWSEERERFAFVFARADGKWELLDEGDPLVEQAKLE